MKLAINKKIGSFIMLVFVYHSVAAASTSVSLQNFGLELCQGRATFSINYFGTSHNDVSAANLLGNEQISLDPSQISASANGDILANTASGQLVIGQGTQGEDNPGCQFYSVTVAPGAQVSVSGIISESGICLNWGGVFPTPIGCHDVQFNLSISSGSSSVAQASCNYVVPGNTNRVVSSPCPL
jgi:hypothetical protein